MIARASTRATPAARLPGIELLRLIAAVCILCLHARAVFGGQPWFGRGYLGVEFFLMLSGLLMTVRQEPRLAAGADPWRFMARRVARLWPLIALSALLGLPLAWVRATSAGAFARHALPNVAMLPGIGSDFAFPANIPEWTIFAELLANTVHILLLWRLGGKGLCAVLTVLTVATLAIGADHGSLDVGAREAVLFAGVVRCLWAYAVGIALARLWGRGGGGAPAAPRWLAVPWPLALLAMPGWVLAGWLCRWHGWWPDALFVIAICPLMLAGALRMRPGARLAGWLGRLAFPLFALQMPMLQGARWLGLGRTWAVVAAVVAATGGLAFETWLERRRAGHSPPM